MKTVKGHRSLSLQPRGKGSLEEDSGAVPRRATSVLLCRSQTDSQSDRAAIVRSIPGFPAPGSFITPPVDFLIADLAPEGAAWGNLHVMGVRGLAPSD
jgi:hypothetical protein